MRTWVSTPSPSKRNVATSVSRSGAARSSVRASSTSSNVMPKASGASAIRSRRSSPIARSSMVTSASVSPPSVRNPSIVSAVDSASRGSRSSSGVVPVSTPAPDPPRAPNPSSSSGPISPLTPTSSPPRKPSTSFSIASVSGISPRKGAISAAASSRSPRRSGCSIIVATVAQSTRAWRSSRNPSARSLPASRSVPPRRSNHTTPRQAPASRAEPSVPVATTSACSARRAWASSRSARRLSTSPPSPNSSASSSRASVSSRRASRTSSSSTVSSAVTRPSMPSRRARIASSAASSVLTTGSANRPQPVATSAVTTARLRGRSTRTPSPVVLCRRGYDRTPRSAAHHPHPSGCHISRALSHLVEVGARRMGQRSPDVPALAGCASVRRGVPGSLAVDPVAPWRSTRWLPSVLSLRFVEDMRRSIRRSPRRSCASGTGVGRCSTR